MSAESDTPTRPDVYGPDGGSAEDYAALFHIPAEAPNEELPIEKAVRAEAPRSETERLDPAPLEMVLESGTRFELEPLKLRQFLRLLRIITRGAADVLDGASLDFENADSFVQQFIGMVLFSIPEAEEETVDFIQSMVRPVNMTGNPDKDVILIRELYAELENPSLEDTVTIIQSIFERESEDLRALGKRLGSMFKVAQKMGATKSTGPTQI